VAVNGSVPPVTEEADAGETVTEVTDGVGGAGAGVVVTITVAEANLVGSATLVAVTLPVLEFDGAVKSPEDVMLPIDATQLTDSFVVVPCMLALNCILPLGAREAEEGETATEVTPFEDPPLPCSGTTTGRCLRSVTIDRLPSTSVGADARNFTVKLLLCPAVRVNGGVTPATLKPGPLMAASLTSRPVVPTFVTVTICEPVLPTGVLTDRLLGVTESCGRGSAKPEQPDVHPVIRRTNVRIRSTNTLLSCHELIVFGFSLAPSCFFLM
jgi:hypothetical protein